MTFAAAQLERIISASAACPDAWSPLGAFGHQSIKTCPKCGGVKKFYRNRAVRGSGIVWYCQPCRFKKVSAKNKRRQNLAYRAKYPQKILANKAVAYALSNGTLERKPCQVCGATERIHAHHDDYSRRLDVMWLCPQHHKDRHRELNEAANAA